MGIAYLFKQLKREIVIFLLDQASGFFINSASKRKITVGFMLRPKVVINVSAQFNGQFISTHETKLTKQHYINAEYIPIIEKSNYF